MLTAHGHVTSSVPSGASTGVHEALELRDGGVRYLGRGVQHAVHNVNSIIAPALKGKDPRNQRAIDELMIRLDRTVNKSKLGANAILSVSMAAARAAALEQKQHLFEYLAALTKHKPLLPLPFCNVINGGKHAESNLKFQEFMIVPVGMDSFREAVQCVAEVYHLLKICIEKKHGKMAANVGDEGGFAPPIHDPHQAFELMLSAIDEVGYQGKVKLAMDAAASEFFRNGYYFIPRRMSPSALVDYYVDLIKTYPLISLEDPFAQDDFSPYEELMQKARIQIVGDDLLVTNMNRVSMAIERKLCNALLLKVNQVGTLTEAIDAARMAFLYDWQVMVSHRSGETEDSFIADLAVALGCGQIKLGAPCRGERVAKINQLLRIEEMLGRKAHYATWKGIKNSNIKTGKDT